MAKHKVIRDPHVLGAKQVGDEVEVPDEYVAAYAAVGLIEAPKTPAKKESK